MTLPHPSSRPFIRQRATGPFWYGKWSRSGTPVIRSLGRAWVEPDGHGGWRRRRGRAPEGTLTETEAAVRMHELVFSHDEELCRLEADAEERRRRGVSFRELAAEWIVYLEREKGAKASTLRDYRWLLAEPGQGHRRGTGSSPGVMMAKLGDRAAKDLTTRDIAEYLRSLDQDGASPRTVNKHRQVISAVFSFGMRKDTYRLPANPAAGTNKRREPPAAVLDFYEPEEVEAIARAAAAGAHRNVTRLRLDEAERAARVGEDQQDASSSGSPPTPACASESCSRFTGMTSTWSTVAWSCTGRSATGSRVRRRAGRHGSADCRRRGRGVRPARRARRLHLTDDYVFPNRLGRPLDGSALRRRFKAAAEAAGLRVLRFHALRHGAGSLVARRADARWVQAFLGHSKLTTTERYLHAKARPEDVDLLNSAFASVGAGPGGPRHRVATMPAGTLQEWDRVVNEDPLPNPDPNRTVLARSGGRPATREELLEFARENDTRIERERTGR